MKPEKETKQERFCRVATARTNKIIDMLRLLGNCAAPNVYGYTRDQVEQIFHRLQSDLIKAKTRFLAPENPSKKRFSLGEPYEIESAVKESEKQTFAISLPDGTFLRAVAYPDDSYPSINIYWDNGKNDPNDSVCFVKYNPEKDGNQKVCIAAYREDMEETAYYAPYASEEN